MNTAAGPWPVQVVVRSVPHIVSTVPGTMLPSCAFGPRGAPARPGASSRCSEQRFKARQTVPRYLIGCQRQGVELLMRQVPVDRDLGNAPCRGSEQQGYDNLKQG